MADDAQNKTIQDSTRQPHADLPVGQTPIDPTDNAAGMMNDTTGMTGVSKDTNDPNTPSNNQSVSRTMSDTKYQNSIDPLPEDQDTRDSNADSLSTATPGSIPTGNDTLEKTSQPHISGEQGMNATNPDPASDDDTLANAQQVGLRQDEDEEHPKELDIASDIDKAEDYHNTH